MSGFRIRTARGDELEQLSAIEGAAQELFPPERLTNTRLIPIVQLRAGRERDLLWVAACEEQPVGFCLAETFGADLHVVEIDVLPDHGRRGIGTALMRTVIAAARRRGFRRVTLTTFGDLPWNRPFYEHVGFVVVEPGSQEVRLSESLASEEARGLVQRVAMVLSLGARDA